MIKIVHFLMVAVLLGSCTGRKIEIVDEPGNDNPGSNDQRKEMVIEFTPRSGTFADTALVWQEGKAESGSRPSTLVIYLHGGSSKGSDNALQMREAAIAVIKDYLQRKSINAVFIVPQCPSDASWGGRMNRPLKLLIDSYNCTKIYAFGGSMGGTGVGSLVSAYPEIFTAAMPVAWNPEMSNAQKMSAVPIYTVMGDADTIMSVDKVRNFLSEFTSNGGVAEMEVETGWTHGDTCEKSYTDSRFNWVFSH